MRPEQRNSKARRLHGLISGEFSQASTGMLSTDEWADLFALAVETKTSGLAAHALSIHAVPNELSEQIAAVRKSLLAKTLANLDWTIKVTAVLDTAGIENLAFKGPLRAKQVYGTWDVKHSNDIDLLVRPDHYKQAKQALVANGYAPLVPEESLWWHNHLGEAPFRHSTPGCPCIDLHHTIQQPGGPYPLCLDEFFTDSHVEKLGRNNVRIPSRFHALLICAVGYGKAIRAQEPTLSYLHEMSVATNAFGEKDLHALIRLAERQGLSRLLQECLSKSRELFPRNNQHTVQDEPIIRAIKVGPKNLLRRTRLLWRWTDGPLIPRAIRFARGVVWKIRSDMQYWRDQRHLAQPE